MSVLKFLLDDSVGLVPVGEFRLNEPLSNVDREIGNLVAEVHNGTLLFILNVLTGFGQDSIGLEGSLGQDFFCALLGPQLGSIDDFIAFLPSVASSPRGLSLQH